MGDLSSKAALVTGAQPWHRPAIAETLASDGALVIVHFGRNSDAAEETVGGIASRGDQAFSLQADLASPGEIERFFAALDEEAYGKQAT